MHFFTDLRRAVQRRISLRSRPPPELTPGYAPRISRASDAATPEAPDIRGMYSPIVWPLILRGVSDHGQTPITVPMALP